MLNPTWRKYRRTLEKELGEELAKEFVESLYLQSHGCIETAAQFFYNLGTMWSPLMYAWNEWIEQNDPLIQQYCDKLLSNLT